MAEAQSVIATLSYLYLHPETFSWAPDPVSYGACPLSYHSGTSNVLGQNSLSLSSQANLLQGLPIIISAFQTRNLDTIPDSFLPWHLHTTENQFCWLYLLSNDQHYQCPVVFTATPLISATMMWCHLDYCSSSQLVTLCLVLLTLHLLRSLWLTIISQY